MKRRTSRLLLRLSLTLLLLPSLAAADSACGLAATAISTVQGDGSESPLAGQQVTVEGILTLDSRASGGFGGFYLQQADAETDNNPATSEALFVYTRRTAGEPGSRVRVTGTVKEFHGLTELVSIQSLQVCGRASLPAPIQLTLPWNQPPESLENMRVVVPQTLTVVDSYNLARYGELALAANDPVQPTEYLPPGPGAHEMGLAQQRQRLLLDDNRGERNPRPVPWPPSGLSMTNPVRAGDRVQGLQGVLDFRFDAWRLQPDAEPGFVEHNPRAPAPARLAGQSLRILGLNLANYFNGDGHGDGFPTPRGAETAAGLQSQQARLVAALTAPDPDILAVTELENDGYGPESAIEQLRDALGEHWRFVRTPGADGDDQIRTALLFRADRINTLGEPERLGRAPFRSVGRPPLAQVFEANDGSRPVRVIVPHLKSKSCRGARGQDRDQSDGQGCYAARRADEAGAIARWAQALATDGATTDTVIIGDLNSYAREQPLALLARAGFNSAVHLRHPCNPDQCRHYTYRYRGARGNLDYALVSDSLRPRVRQAQTWLINADEPRALGYSGSLSTLSNEPWRSSDHNPVILDLAP